MRIVIDLDGTICHIKKENETYDQLKPMPGAIDTIAKLKADGHYIIIQTARNMATQNSNVGKVLKNIGKITLDWLDRYSVAYDEIYFGKPNADVYVDDRSFRFIDWTQVSTESLNTVAKER
ncbi:MAG: HAD hydrolase family protein [Cyclobacteriaceae bacterium]